MSNVVENFLSVQGSSLTPVARQKAKVVRLISLECLPCHLTLGLNFLRDLNGDGVHHD